MKKLIICTVGTSISNSCPDQQLILRKESGWDEEYPNFRKQISDFINITEGVRKISAEMNSLDRIGINSDDRIVFLSSDNAPGKICSEALKQTLIDKYKLGNAQVEIKRIEGLQVSDAKRFRDIGIKNFIKVVLEYLIDTQIQYSYEIILNPTGGYKGVLPFLTVLGMLYGKKTVYIFEHSNELINLPPLPFTFDLQLYRRVRPALDFIDNNVAVSEKDFINKVLNYSSSERDLFLAFTEPFEDGLITLSPLANCLLNIESQSEASFVSQKVLDKLAKIDGVSSIILKRLISNSSNPTWRNTHLEPWVTTDLLGCVP